MKQCNICNKFKFYTEFHRSKVTADGFDCRCKDCKSDIYKARRDKNPISTYFVAKKSWCKQRGIEFSLTQEYLEGIWTGVCPVFGIKIILGAQGKGSHISAHLDRRDPSKGYVVGNVNWISGRANRIKYDASLEELKQIVAWVEGVTTISKESTLK